MGGEYLPQTRGKIDGRKIGLKNDITIVQYNLNPENEIRDLKLPKPYGPSTEMQYHIGFDKGYLEGQKLRILLKNNIENNMSSDEKIACCGYLLSKQEICRTNVLEIYIQNIKYWDTSILPSEIAKTAQKFLIEKKIQRAIDEIYNYYNEHYNLKGLKEFDEIFQHIKDIRNQKKINKNFNSNKELEKLESKIQNWINHKTQ